MLMVLPAVTHELESRLPGSQSSAVLFVACVHINPMRKVNSSFIYSYLPCFQLLNPKPREIKQCVLGPVAEEEFGTEFLALGSMVFSYYNLILTSMNCFSLILGKEEQRG